MSGHEILYLLGSSYSTSSTHTLGSSYYTWLGRHTTFAISFCNGVGWVCVFMHVPAVFPCGSVFDFSIFHLSGWQFKTTEWNISEPFSKLQ